MGIADHETTASWWIKRLLLALVLVVSSVKGHDWWQAREQQLARAAALALPSSPSASPHRAPEAVSETTPDHRTSDEARQVRVAKCTVNGRVTYSDPADCPGGTMATIRVEDSRGEASPEGLSDYQLEMLRAADLRIARDQAAADADLVEQHRAISSQQGECDGLAVQIRNLDAAARQPLTAYQQDMLRQDRMRLRSRQAALRC